MGSIGFENSIDLNFKISLTEKPVLSSVLVGAKL